MQPADGDAQGGTPKRARRAPAGGSLVVTVAEAVRRELEKLGENHPGLASSALAMSVLAMAREIDDPDNSATSKSMCQARLQDALDRLHELIPPEEEGDALDELSARRADRLARQAGT